MTLTYWVCHHMTDAPAYAFRAKTRRECLAFLSDPKERDFREANYSAPAKITVQYEGAFDLLQACMGEGSLREEALSRYDAVAVREAREGEDDAAD